MNEVRLMMWRLNHAPHQSEQRIVHLVKLDALANDIKMAQHHNIGPAAYPKYRICFNTYI